MRKLSYLFAIAAIGGLVSLAPASSAGPIAGKMAGANNSVPMAGDGLVQNVHGWHCRRRYSKRLGWHRHKRACYEEDFDYYDDDYYSYQPYYYGAPFLSFSFGDFDRRHHRRRHHRKHHW